MPELPVPMWAQTQNHFIAPIQAGIQMGNLLLGMKAQRQQMEQAQATFPLRVKALELANEQAAYQMAAENEKLNWQRIEQPLKLKALQSGYEQQDHLWKMRLRQEDSLVSAARHDEEQADDQTYGTPLGLKKTAQFLQLHPQMWGTDWHKNAVDMHTKASAAAAANEKLDAQLRAAEERAKLGNQGRLDVANVRANAIRNKMASGSGGPGYMTFMNRQYASEVQRLVDSGVDTLLANDLALALLDDSWAKMGVRQKEYVDAEETGVKPAPLSRMSPEDVADEQKISAATIALNNERTQLIKSGKPTSSAFEKAQKNLNDLTRARDDRKARSEAALQGTNSPAMGVGQSTTIGGVTIKRTK